MSHACLCFILQSIPGTCLLMLVNKSWAKSHLSFSFYNPEKKKYILHWNFDLKYWFDGHTTWIKKTANQIFSSKFHCRYTLIKKFKTFFTDIWTFNKWFSTWKCVNGRCFLWRKSIRIHWKHWKNLWC